MSEQPAAMPGSVEEINLLDSRTIDCPYHAYKLMRDKAPVYLDPNTGFYVVSRFEDVKKIFANSELYSSKVYGKLQEKASSNKNRVQQIFAEKGWRPAPTLGSRDDPEHAELRKIFTAALNPRTVKELDAHIRNIAYRTVDGFIGNGRCEVVTEFARPVPLRTMMMLLDAREQDMEYIVTAVDFFGRRISHMATEEEELKCVEEEIKVQHYFQPIIEKLRKEPSGTILSNLINTRIEAWGRHLTDAEIHSEIIGDFFFGGADTTKNALSGGVQYLIEHPEVHALLRSDRERHLKAFIEEIVRYVSPAQASPRRVKADVELHGVRIPKGSVVSLRLGAANRDERRFAEPDRIDLGCENPTGHIAFGFGIHTCIGAPLARREMWWAFTALLEHVESMRFAPGKNDFRHQPHYLMRQLRELHIEFDRK